MMISVSVSELRRDLNKLLHRVQDEGITIEVTLRGEPVARIVPIEKQAQLTHDENNE